MNPDEILVSETLGWTLKAHDDLISARILAVAGQESNALFHCQQCVEKILKAFLTSKNHPFRKTHNLKELGEACIALDASLAEVASKCYPLSDYAWMLRYPGEQYLLAVGEVTSVLELAAEMFAEIQFRLFG